jgi:AcrR family transcriptional regulator
VARRGRADRAQIIQIAADLADRVGFDALNLPEIAAALDVRVPSLYNHVAGLDDIRRGVTLLALDRLAATLREAAIGRSGADAIRALAHAYRHFARAHPGWYAATQASGRYQDPEAVAAGNGSVSVAVAVLAAYHLHADDALHAVRALRSLLHGFVDLELHHGFGMALDLDESYQRLVETFIAGLQRIAQAGSERAGC